MKIIISCEQIVKDTGNPNHRRFILKLKLSDSTGLNVFSLKITSKKDRQP